MTKRRIVLVTASVLVVAAAVATAYVSAQSWRSREVVACLAPAPRDVLAPSPEARIRAALAEAESASARGDGETAHARVEEARALAQRAGVPVARGLEIRTESASTGMGRAVQPESDAAGTESYAGIDEPGFRNASDEPVSTFSTDVDTASASNVRRFILDEGRLPPPDAVRIEELLNAFRYDDPAPGGREPFSVSTEVATCPWEPGHRLLRIGLRGRSIPPGELPARNLAFLVDVSGSMNQPNKLPLVKRALSELVENLGRRDRVAIVVYAGAAGLVLEPTPGDRKDEILRALDGLRPGGSTNGAQGIRLAYRLAEESFVEGGANRVVLCTDGDFNVGVTSEDELTALMEQEREKGIFLTVLGFGRGNLKDSRMEAIADRGNGNYAYIDSFAEARKVLVEEADAWLVTIAKDVKIQVEMDPDEVASYRLVGYENRALANEDFEDDRKDAGEIGAGHAVVALYEIVPRLGARGRDLAEVRLRWKEPDGDRSELATFSVRDHGAAITEASQDMRFCAGVATFGLALRRSEHAPGATLKLAEVLVEDALGSDPGGHRAELVHVVKSALELDELEPRLVTTR